ncbi:MAG: hypothetical protein IMZ62_10205 [Chloroflexi bacterium]|nr:hypothetical protein [Chloroflexota bacterium]
MLLNIPDENEPDPFARDADDPRPAKKPRVLPSFFYACCYRCVGCKKAYQHRDSGAVYCYHEKVKTGKLAVPITEVETCPLGHGRQLDSDHYQVVGDTIRPIDEAEIERREAQGG